MLLIKTYDHDVNKDECSFKIEFRVQSRSKLLTISEFKAVINAMYHADEELFEIALASSDAVKAFEDNT